ncbi:MAG: hypothetical protein MJ175_05825 [Clostridia bacterium]|nr:hypothetical protein [Clostridia bacterium]
MKYELYHYLAIPSVYRVGTETEIVIRPLESKYEFTDGGNYKVAILPLSTRHDMIDRLEKITVTPKIVNGTLRFSYTFPNEDEYYLQMICDGKNMDKLAVYALNDDLYALRPLKGDTHIHSCRSDGKETPAIVAANYRAAGYDFIGLTDHHKYAPSVEAIEAYKDIRLGMTQMFGEEVHSPETYLHIVHFGGMYSVNKIFEDDKEKFLKEVDKIDRELGEGIPFTDARSRFVYASAVWCVREIRKAGGIAIFPHPFWIWTVYNVPTEMTRRLILGDVFDAFELISGQSAHENNYQTQFYYTLKDEYWLENGRPLKLPVLGASDSHGTVNRWLFNHKFSVVFAKSRRPEDILDAIRNGQSVAVEIYEEGETHGVHSTAESYGVHGDYRLMAYGRFLCENYFPRTQKLCAVDGALMQEYSMGSEEAGRLLAMRADVTDQFYQMYFGR